MRTEKSAANETSKLNKLVVPVAIGMLIGIVVSLVMLLLFSLVMTMKDVPQGAVSTLTAVSIAIGCLAGGFASAKLHQRAGLATGAVTGFLLYLILMFIGSGVQGAMPSASVLIKFAVSLASGGIGGIFGVNFHKKQKN